MDCLSYTLFALLLRLSLAFCEEKEENYTEPVNQMPVNQMPVNQMPVNQMNVTEMPVNKMPVNEMPVNVKPVNETPVETRNVLCRNQPYPYKNQFQREYVPDNLVSWDVEWPSYNPPNARIVVTYKRYIDPIIASPLFKPKWNAIDNDVNRISFTGPYKVVNDLPVNPVGRTGLTGRGLLDRWGPNINVNVIFTRWKLSKLKRQPILNNVTKEPILQVLTFRHRGRENLGIPGKVMFPKEQIIDTIKRVYFNGVTKRSVMESLAGELYHVKVKIELFLELAGMEIYRGYVDDPLNTDNAWVETVAVQYHCDKRDLVARLPVRKKLNEVSAEWVDLTDNMHWIARHAGFAQRIIRPEFNLDQIEFTSNYRNASRFI